MSPPPDVEPPSPTSSTLPPTTSTAPTPDLDAIDAEWARLDELCRGQTPPDEAACAQRDELTEPLLLARADAFFTAWRAGDLATAQSYVSPEFRAPLDSFTPTVEPHTCEVDIQGTGQMRCRAEVEEGPWGVYVIFDLYGAGTTPRQMVVVMIGPDDIG